MDVTELERAYKAAKDTSDIKAIVVIIIPGNPTGQVLKRENLEAVIKFAAEKKLFVFADEVIIDHEDDILEFISTSSGISAECLCRRLSFAQFQEGDDGDGCSLQPAGGGQLHVVVNPPSPVDVVTADDATTEEMQGYYTVDICCSNVYCSTLGKYIVYILALVGSPSQPLGLRWATDAPHHFPAHQPVQASADGQPGACSSAAYYAKYTSY